MPSSATVSTNTPDDGIVCRNMYILSTTSVFYLVIPTKLIMKSGLKYGKLVNSWNAFFSVAVNKFPGGSMRTICKPAWHAYFISYCRGARLMEMK
jgi:hypothetical protein